MLFSFSEMLRRIKNSLIYHFTMVAVTLTGLVPARFTRKVGQIIGTIAHKVATNERALSHQNMSTALGRPTSSPAIALLTRGVFLSLAQSAVELCALYRSQDKSPPVIIPESSKLCLGNALAKGRGVVFVTGHIGNWELMAFALASSGYPISTIAKESYDSRFTKLIERFRGSCGVEVIYRGNPGSSAAMLRTLKRNRILGFLIDQDTRVPSEFVPFFGRQAHTPIGAASFAIRCKAPTVIGTIRRNRHGIHIIEIEQCPVGDDVPEATAKLTEELENRIRRSKTQWVWFHDRWKTRPENEMAQ